MQHHGGHRHLRETPAAWRSSSGHLGDPDRKGAAEGVLSRVARNAVRELATRPGRTVATVLLALAVIQAALSRRRVGQPSARPDPDLQGKIAAAGLLGALYLVLLSGCGAPPPGPVAMSPDSPTVRCAHSSSLVEPDEGPAPQDRIGCEVIHADAGLHDTVVERFLTETTSTLSGQRLAGPAHGSRQEVRLRLPHADGDVDCRDASNAGHARTRGASLFSVDPKAAWLPRQVRGVAQLAC